LDQIIIGVDALANIKTIKLVISKDDRSLDFKVLERYFTSAEMKSMNAKFKNILPTSFELDF
jgi:hypothetical protein